MQHALEALNKLIADGWEYPDAHARVSTAHAVDSHALQAAYDQQFN